MQLQGWWGLSDFDIAKMYLQYISDKILRGCVWIIHFLLKRLRNSLNCIDFYTFGGIYSYY